MRGQSTIKGLEGRSKRSQPGQRSTYLAAIAGAGHCHVPIPKVDATLSGIVSPRLVFDVLAKHLADAAKLAG